MVIRIDKKSTSNRTILDMNQIGIHEIVSIGRYTYSKPYRKLYPEIFDNFYEFIYIEKGEQDYYIENEKIKLKNGELLIIRPHEEHSTGHFFEKRGKVYWIIGNIDFLSFFGSDKNIGKQIINKILNVENRIIKMNLEFENILKNIFRIYTELKQDVMLNREKIKHCLFFLFVTIYEVIESHGANELYYKDIRITKAIQYIEKNIYDNIDIRFLSLQIAHMSLPYFSKQFKTYLGYTPRDYINLKKIEQAKIILKTKNSISSVSRELGFSSSQYFATVFMKYTGMTPTEFLDLY